VSATIPSWLVSAWFDKNGMQLSESEISRHWRRCQELQVVLRAKIRLHEPSGMQISQCISLTIRK